MMESSVVQLEKTRMRTIAKSRAAVDICVSRARKAIESGDTDSALNFLNKADIAVSAQQGQINWCVDGDSYNIITEAKRDYGLD